MNETDKPIEVESVPTTALAVRPEQPVVNPLDLDPKTFSEGLSRRKENRKALIEWVREALVEGTDFGRIPTKRGPSKPSLWKPGAEKICGMLGVTPTFPNLPEYEKACLAGVQLKQVMLRCEIVNSDGRTIAHGVGCRSLEQDYGDLNKAIKMAEKSAHIDATLRMAGLSEIFTQDIEDMPKMTQDAPMDPGPSQPRKTGKTAPTPHSAPTPATKTQYLEECRAKLVKNIDTAQMREKSSQFLIDLAWLMPNEPLEKLELRFVPQTKDEYLNFLAKVALFAATGKAEKPYAAHWEAEKPAAPKEAPPSPPVAPATDDAADQPWYHFVVPVPRKGQKRDDYLKHPDTIGSLFEARHETDEESQALRQRLWGFLNHFEPKPHEYKGKTYPPSDTDKKFRQALDAFGDWFEKHHHGEEL